MGLFLIKHLFFCFFLHDWHSPSVNDWTDIYWIGLTWSTCEQYVLCVTFLCSPSNFNCFWHVFPAIYCNLTFANIHFILMLVKRSRLIFQKNKALCSATERDTENVVAAQCVFQQEVPRIQESLRNNMVYLSYNLNVSRA